MAVQPQSKLTLDKPVTYQIVIPDQLEDSWSDWIEGMTVTVKCLDDSITISTLTCRVDQAALQGLLRRLYSLGFPLISVNYIENAFKASQPPKGE